MVTRLRREGFAAVHDELSKLIEQAEGKKKDKLNDFYKYVYNNQDGLLDLDQRRFNPSCLPWWHRRQCG